MKESIAVLNNYILAIVTEDLSSTYFHKILLKLAIFSSLCYSILLSLLYQPQPM